MNLGMMRWKDEPAERRWGYCTIDSDLLDVLVKIGGITAMGTVEEIVKPQFDWRKALPLEMFCCTLGSYELLKPDPPYRIPYQFPLLNDTVPSYP